jgi:hypothetical protein
MGVIVGDGHLQRGGGLPEYAVERQHSIEWHAGARPRILECTGAATAVSGRVESYGSVRYRAAHHRATTSSSIQAMRSSKVVLTPYIPAW